MSADKNDEYLSDGMTEELINAPGQGSPGFARAGAQFIVRFSKGKKNEDDIFSQSR